MTWILCECGDCALCKKREYMRGYRARNPERMRKLYAESYYRNREKILAAKAAEKTKPGYRERMNEAKTRSIARDPQKHAARLKVQYALKRGHLVRGGCEVCGAKNRVQAHHDDYSRPLDVRWLCPDHHYQLHRKWDLP